MSTKSVCDNCGKCLDETPEMTYTLHHGGLLVDVKVGIDNYFKGCLCHECIKNTFDLISKHGIFEHRKISLPSNIVPTIKETTKRTVFDKGFDVRSEKS